MQRQGTEPVRVVVQARPVLRHETANNDASTVRISTDPPLITVTDGKRDPKIFDQFDGVYNGAPETIFRLFESHVAPLVAGAFQGVNATTLAYGQTAAGKTFTIDAILEEIGRDVFRRANDINTNTDSRVIITCSVIEVYQDSFVIFSDVREMSASPSKYTRPTLAIAIAKKQSHVSTLLALRKSVCTTRLILLVSSSSRNAGASPQPQK